MKMTKLFLLGSSVIGLALGAAVAAQAATDEAPATNAAAIADANKAAAEPKDESPKSRGFYAGTSIGGSFFEGPGKNSKIFNHDPADTNGDGQSDAFVVSKIDNENNFMWSVFAGYRMADWLGAEVGWTNIGGFKAYDTGVSPAHNNHTTVDVDGLEARLRAWTPLGTERVQGIGGLGIFIFSSHPPKYCDGPDTGACTPSPGHFGKVPPALDPREDSGQAFTISAGLQFQITDNILLRTEYQHFFAVLDQGVDMVTATLVVGFYDFFGQGAGGDSMGGVTVE
jgi:opacity protein-like surface antigen